MPVGPGLYSRIVATLKVGLPLVAVAMLAALFLMSEEDDGGTGLVFTPSDIDALGEGLSVTNPTFTGTTDEGDPFRFTAAEVIPDAAPPTRAAITTLAGSLEFRAGPTAQLRAETAVLDLGSDRMDLDGAVEVRTSDGYTVVADHMVVDLGSGVLEAEGGVATTGPMGRIDSRTLRVGPAPGEDARSGRRVFSFGDGVRLVYDPASASD